MKTMRMGTVVALLLVGCGGGEPGKMDERSDVEEAAENESLSCDDIEQAVEHIQNGLGSCTPTFKNQEPLAFSRSACDAQLNTSCDSASLEHALQYVNCLQAVPACNPAQQALFDNAIDDCADTFQNSGAAEACIELVIGD